MSLTIFVFSCHDPDLPHSVATEGYIIDSIEMPEGLSGEVGALDFLPDGRLVAGFRRGEIMIYDPGKDVWKVFARGLHLPLGILAGDSTSILVMQYPELTELKDTDEDGIADEYVCVTDGFGLGGNYHEFAYGPVRDNVGNLYFALNSTSMGGKMMEETRGEINKDGLREKGMYSAVPYRGWVMKLTPEGDLQPFASGFRSPDGIGFDSAGRLLVTDNQGDWVGTSPLYVVEEGRFYGHPASLVWTEGWDKGKPTELPLDTLESMREKAAVLFPHNIMANSPTQPVPIETDYQFGPFEGQLLVGEMNSERIVRVILEEVNGRIQGACVPFIDGKGLRKGNHRLAFAPDGSLWVGQNASGWAGSSGIQKITFGGKVPTDILSVALTSHGFEFKFTAQMPDSVLLDTSNYDIKSYYYEYHAPYGSDQFDKKSVLIEKVEVFEDRRGMNLVLDRLAKDRIYEFNFKNFHSLEGDTLQNTLLCYTLNELK